MLKKWKLLSSEWVLNEKWYKVRKEIVEIKPGKIVNDYFFGVFNDVVMVVAITEDGIVPLVQQYKHGFQDIITELPAGYLNDGEDILEAAKRELREETGYESDDWSKLGYFVKNPTKLRGDNTHIYLAKNARKTSQQNLDENENIELIEIPFEEALLMAKSGELKTADTTVGLFLAEGSIG